MKIIHCADLHLGSKMETNLSTEQAPLRRTEILLTFERMVEYAQANQVQVIMIAGDMFDTPRIANVTKQRIINCIQKHPKIDFLYLSGNHDESNFINQIEVRPANLKIFTDQWTMYHYGQVDITGAILTGINANVLDQTLQLAADKVNIVVMHGQITKYGLAEDAENINLNRLKGRHIDYLALGHLHQYSQGRIDDRGIYCYAGCLEGRGFDECGPKGFVLLDIQGATVASQFVPFAKREFVSFEFDITGYDDWFQFETDIFAKVKDTKVDNLLKITIVGKYQLNLEKQLEHLRVKLAERFFFVKIKDQTSLQIDLADFDKDISLRSEFIKDVMAADLTPEMKEQVILLGLKALNGEELHA